MLLYLINCQVTFVFADVKTVKPPYLDQEQHLQHLDMMLMQEVMLQTAEEEEEQQEGAA